MSIGREVVSNISASVTSEQKQAGDIMRKSEEFYRSMIELSPNAIVAADSKGVVLICNTAAAGLFGYSKGELEGKHFSRTGLIQLKDTSRYLEVFNSARGRKNHEPFELAFRRKGGAVIWTEIRIGWLKLGGKMIVQSTMRDITERKLMEEKLRIKDSAIASSISAIAIADLSGNLTYVNKSFLQMWGYDDVQEVLGKPAVEFWQMEEEAAEVGGALRDSGGWIAELVARRKEGLEFDVQLSSSVVMGEAGEPVCTMASFVDITGRKRAEKALQESEGKLNAMLQSIGDHMSMMDKDLNIIWTNKTAQKVFGGNIIGKKCYEVYHGRKEPCEPYPCLTLKAFQDGKIHEHDTEVIDKEGKTIYFHCAANVALRDKQGEPTAVIETSKDITERKRMDEALQEKTRQLEVASQAKSAFLASMSHELRTPLNAIVGFSELMLDGVTGEINDEQRQCLSDVLNSGQHLLNLINDVLDLSKVEAGKIELKLENLNLANIIDGVLQTMKPIIDEHKHKLAVTMADGFPEVYADKSRLRQVLLNLLGNAIKFTPPGGELRIEVNKEGDWCQVSMIDNGIGIKKEDQEHIFEVFTQVDTLPKDMRGGTGLGLAITKQFIEAIGGCVWVESKYGKGSSFTFTLPLAREGEPYLENEDSKSGWQAEIISEK